MPDAPDPRGPHMSPEAFRRHGHTVVDWIADYLAGVEQHPVHTIVSETGNRFLNRFGNNCRRLII